MAILVVPSLLSGSLNLLLVQIAEQQKENNYDYGSIDQSLRRSNYFQFVFKMLNRKNCYFFPLKQCIKSSTVIDSPYEFNVKTMKKDCTWVNNKKTNRYNTTELSSHCLDNCKDYDDFIVSSKQWRAKPEKMKPRQKYEVKGLHLTFHLQILLLILELFIK